MCRMDYAYFTDKGDREHNEDYIGFSEAGDKKIFVLADGLGGHGKGEVASCLVKSSLTIVLLCLRSVFWMSRKKATATGK